MNEEKMKAELCEMSIIDLVKVSKLVGEELQTRQGPWTWEIVTELVKLNITDPEELKKKFAILGERPSALLTIKDGKDVLTALDLLLI
jgi:hypothetical protein